MDTEKLSYPGIAGAVAGVVGLAGVYASWFQISGPSGALKVDGVADASGTLALAMSLALFAFSVAYVLMADVPLRRAFAALMTVTAVVLTLSCIWGVARADGADLAFGIYLSGLGGVLGVASGILTLRDAPPDGVIPDEAEAAAS
ncbi:MAG: hypothetical protein OEW66_11370 [Actinomycetota bacterium]|nr:hypothetical protein [Actinomycetota bacterium]